MPTRLTVTTRPLVDDRPLVDLLPVDDGYLWTRGGEGLAGWGQAVRVPVGVGQERVVRAEAALAELAEHAHRDDAVGVPGGGLLAFASLTFDPATHGSVLVVPRRVVVRRGGTTALVEVDGPGLADDVPGPAQLPHPEPVRDRVRFAGSSLPDVAWLAAVATAVEQIEGGELEKVVLARDHAVWSHHRLDPRWLAGRLHRRFPDCFTFLVDAFIGATPELLVRRDGDRVTSVALAGTVPRHDDPAQDRAAGEALLASDKDRREHAFAARSVAAALRPVCAELEVSAEPFLLRLDNVAHLASEVHGTLLGRPGVLALADRLHPTAAVGGTPRDRAVAAIRLLEGMDRGRYAGPVGWVAADGDGELGIALRCAELSGARARLFAGAGVVAGSLPEDELEETRVKLRAMQGALDAWTPPPPPPPPPEHRPGPPPPAPRPAAPTPGTAGTAGGDREVAPVAPVGDQPLAPRVVGLWRAGGAVPTVLLLLVTVPVALGVGGWTVVLPVLALLLGVLLVGMLPGMRYARWRWRLTPLALELEHGVVLRQARALPFFRIQHIDLQHGPLDRALGLARLEVHTASVTATLPGLPADQAPGIRVALLERAAAAVAEVGADADAV